MHMNAQHLSSTVGHHSVSSLPALLKDRRAWLSRLAFRAPLALYRIGLGGLLGHQFLVLTHVGRRTGQIHETVLKVLHYDATTHESIVASAWGAEADWYRNLQVRPALAVRTAGAWYVPETRTLPADEAFAVFTDWTRRQHQFAELMLGQIGLSWDVPEAEQRAIVAGFPFIAFRPAATDGVAR
jgi:deazaflavin-dependent oxidoreductase (nitroreductase family)